MAPDRVIAMSDSAPPPGQIVREDGPPGCRNTSDMRTRIERPGLGAPLAALLLLLSPACGRDTPTLPTAPAPPRDPGPAEIGAWLDTNAHPFEGAHLSLPHDDLEFLRDLVGDARVVALGENTHGARDFFEMKARILRFLVEEMGFDTFAIEATWPEGLRLDRYVRTGEGDPARLLAGLYFWTWNTEAVLEMIEWMRDHNEAGGDVGFHGVDMQSPGMALHLVREYIGLVAPDRLDFVTAELDCLDRFANGPTGRFPRRRYRDETDAYRAECGASLEEVRALLVENRESYEAADGADGYAIALRSLRVAYQYHLQAVGEQYRDESMAENTVWLSERIGPEGRMVLWAHNYHVSAQPGAQGYYQRQAFGDDMVIVGFSHEGGSFTAVGQTEDSSGTVRYTGQRSFTLDPPVEGSFEASFAEAAAPRFVLDLRGLSNDPVGAWLSEPRPSRDIGCCYDPDRPESYWQDTPLPEWYDAVIHFESTRPTALLPYRPPTTW